MKYKGDWVYTRECEIKSGGWGKFFKSDSKYAIRCPKCKTKNFNNRGRWLVKTLKKNQKEGKLDLRTGIQSRLYAKVLRERYGI